ncbi:MAG: TrkA C-terminal domain-containing protein, partial [Ignavibacteriaceae bacterium]
FPVVDSNDPSKVLGALTRQKVISMYNRETLKENLVSGLAKELKTIDRSTPTKVASGYSIMEVALPDSFVGKTLAELKLRNTFGLEVLMIKHLRNIFENKSDPEIVSPDPHYKLGLSDRLILFGEDKKLNHFINLH